MPKKTSTSIQIEFGERVISNSESVRLYFFLTSPTGQTSNIVDSDKVKKVSFQKLVDMDGIGGRLFRVSYDVYSPIVITMIAISTRLGRRTRNNKVVMTVGDTDNPKLEIIGGRGFGKIIGHIKIETDNLPKDVTVNIIESGSTSDKESNLGLIW